MSRVDDLTIVNAAALWRRVESRWLHYDDNMGRIRASSGALDHEELSIVLGDDAQKAGRTHLEVQADFPGQFVFSFPAGVARSKQQIVCRDPEEGEEHHGLVVGKKTGSVCKALYKAAVCLSSIPEDVVREVMARSEA